MRLEIDEELAGILDRIKLEEPLIYGRGHVETVRFLANYYNTRERLQALMGQLEHNLNEFLLGLDDTIEAAIEHGIFKATRAVIINLLRPADENQPQRDLDSGSQAPGEGR